MAWQISRFSAIRLSPGRTTSSDIGSGDVWYGVISQGQGLALWQRRIGTGRCEGVGLRIPNLQVFEDSFDHIDIVDERDDFRSRIFID